MHTPFLILAAWIAGGLIALVGAFIYAELAARRPRVGGQYAYLREAYHPLLAFVYGWGLLLVIQTGGMAASAVTFARYFHELTEAPVPDRFVAALVLGALAAINCLGVRAGGSTQNALMVLKILAIATLPQVKGFVRGALATGALFAATAVGGEAVRVHTWVGLILAAGVSAVALAAAAFFAGLSATQRRWLWSRARRVARLR